MMNIDEKCIKCEKVAQLMCQRCHDPYCSLICQVADWRMHKKKCIPIPLLVPLAKNEQAVLENIKMNSMIVEEEDEDEEEEVKHPQKQQLPENVVSEDWKMYAMVDHNDDYFEVIVQCVEEAEKLVWLFEVKNEKLQSNLIQKMQRQVRFNSPCTLADLRVAQLVLAVKERPYRAVVLSIDNQTCQVQVQLIDRGSKLQLKIGEIFCANETMASIPALVFPAVIANTQDLPMRYTRLLVRLLEQSSPDKYYCVEIQQKTALSQVVPVKLCKVLDTSTKYIFLQRQNNELEYEKMQKQLQTIKAQPNNLNVYDKVAAYFNKIWYRGLLLDNVLCPDNYLVYLLDVGRVCFCQVVVDLPSNFKEPTDRIVIVQTSEELDKSHFNLKMDLIFESGETCWLKVQNLDITGKIFTPKKLFQLGNYGYWREELHNESIVRITSFLNYSEIYVCGSDLKLLREIISTAASSSKIITQKDDELLAMDLVLAPNTKNDVEIGYMRASVLGSEDGMIQLSDIDTGEISSVHAHQLRYPTAVVRALPAQLSYITLDISDCPQMDAMKKINAIQGLKHCIKQGLKFKLAKNSDSSLWNLWLYNELVGKYSTKLTDILFSKAAMLKRTVTIDNKKNIGDLQKNLTNINAALEDDLDVSLQSLHINEKEKVNGVKQEPIKVLEKVPVPIGDKVKLFVIDYSDIANNSLTVSTLDDGKILKTMDEQSKMVLKYCQNENVLKKRGFSPRLDEYCLAIFTEDQQWYRAQCVKVLPNNRFLVMFIDYGNFCEVSSLEIIGPLPDELSFPIFANLVQLKGIDIAELANLLLRTPIIQCTVTKNNEITNVTSVN